MQSQDLEKKVGKMFKWGFIAWVVGLVVWLSVIATIVYIAWHFISKVW